MVNFPIDFVREKDRGTHMKEFLPLAKGQKNQTQEIFF